MRVATNADDDDFIHRIMRGRDCRQLLADQDIWLIEPEHEWRTLVGDEFQHFDARRRRLLRHLLRRFSNSIFAHADLHTSFLPGDWIGAGEGCWVIPQPVPLNRLDRQLLAGDWRIWHGTEPEFSGDIWKPSNYAMMIPAMRKVGCSMYLAAFHDNTEWLLSLA